VRADVRAHLRQHRCRRHASQWSRRPRAPPPASSPPSREQVKADVRARLRQRRHRRHASESRCPRAPPPASSSPSRKQVEPTSARASTSVVIAVTQARAQVRARLRRRPRRHHASKWSQGPCAPFRQRCRRRHASKWSRRPRAPPPASSSPSRERELTSASASAVVVIAVTRASGANVRACRRQRRCCCHTSKWSRCPRAPPPALSSCKQHHTPHETPHMSRNSQKPSSRWEEGTEDARPNQAIPSNHLTNPRATPRGFLLEKEREPNLL